MQALVRHTCLFIFKCAFSAFRNIFFDFRELYFNVEFKGINNLKKRSKIAIENRF